MAGTPPSALGSANNSVLEALCKDEETYWSKTSDPSETQNKVLEVRFLAAEGPVTPQPNCPPKSLCSDSSWSLHLADALAATWGPCTRCLSNTVYFVYCHSCWDKTSSRGRVWAGFPRVVGHGYWREKKGETAQIIHFALLKRNKEKLTGILLVLYV